MPLQLVDHTNAVLRGAGLAEADLTGASLEGANFTNAILRNANLTGAKLDRTTFAGADTTWKHDTNLPDGSTFVFIGRHAVIA